MIQFNLLPDLKLEYIRAKKLKRVVITSAIVVASASLLLCLTLVVVNAIQKSQIANLKKETTSNLDELKNTEDLDKILTVQSQLTTLPELHGKKPAAKRVFSYLSDVVPSTVTLSDVTIDFKNSIITIDGLADDGSGDLLAVNTFVDTLKFTDYQHMAKGEGSEEFKEVAKGRAFSKVILTKFDGTTEKALYGITMSFDPAIFDNQKDITLVVPSTITTRSELQRPNVLFEAAPEPKKEEE